jgi:hypothetical protein
VRNDVHAVIDVVLDKEIEAPIFVDSGLPENPAFVVFLGAERWAPEIISPA